MAKMNKTTAGIMLAAVIGGGAIGASALPAMAADTTGGSTSTAASGYGNGYGTQARAPDGSTGAPRGPHQANGKTEELLTGDTAAKVEAAVKAAQPGATIERMETDADGATYEAHITKADGTHATVLFDANFAITETQDQGQGGPGGPGDANWDDATGSSTSNG